MTTLAWILIAGIAMSSIALVGAVTTKLSEETLSRVVMPTVALAAGSLLGGAFFHMLPEAVRALGNNLLVYVWLVAGFLVFFTLEQFLHWHHCHRSPASAHRPLGHLILIADGMHNFIGGLAVGGAFVVDIRVGIVTWLVAALHEVPQEFGDFGILIHSGWQRRSALAWNFASALTFLVGALVAYAVSGSVEVGYLLPFAAGNFIYIAAADLIPEIARETQTRDKLETSLAFLAGLGLLLAVTQTDVRESSRRLVPSWNAGDFATVDQYIPNGVLPERSNIMGLHLGDTAPDFTAMTTDGEISFHDWKQDSWAVFFSHPADFTPVCTTELGRTAALKDEFAKRNTKAMALSIDPIEDHHKWAPDIGEVTGTELNFPIVADPDHRIAELYDMIHPGEGDTSTVRSVFIVDPANKLRLMLTYPKSVGRNFDEIVRVIDALQATDAHPIATPADWQPGQRVIVGLTVSTEDAKKQFDNVEEFKPYLRYADAPR